MKLAVINSLRDVPLQNWQRLMTLEEPSENATISALLDIDEEILRHLKSSSVADLSAHIKELFNRQYNLVRFFELDGEEFGFIPNLDKASHGEIDDITDFISKHETMHKAMAVLFRPVKASKGRGAEKRYRIEDYEPGKYDEVMKRCPLDIALGAQVFFYRLIADLLNSIPSYMADQILEIAGSENFQKNGAGIINSLHSLGVISQEWKRQASEISMSA